MASCEVVYDELPVEGWRLVGERGKGFHHILHGLNPERILLATMACGIGEVAAPTGCQLRQRADRVRPPDRRQPGDRPSAGPGPHAAQGGRRDGGADAAWRYDHGLECGEQANTAKYLAAEASFFAADQALQTHGGLGYASEYHVERYWREARLQRLAPSARR